MFLQTSMTSSTAKFTDIYRLSKWIYYLSKCFGMAPVTVRINRHGQRTVHFSFLSFLYSLILLMIIVPLTLLGLAYDLSHYLSGMTPVRMKNMTSVVVTFCDILSVMSVAAIGILFSALKSGHVSRVVRQIYNIDVYMYTKLPEASLHMSKAERLAKRYMICLILGIFLPLITLFLCDVWVWHKVTGRLPYNYFPVYCLYILVGVLEIQFVYMVWNLQQRFKYFNELLIRITLGLDLCTSLHQETNYCHNDLVSKGTSSPQAPSPSHSTFAFRRRRVTSSPMTSGTVTCCWSAHSRHNRHQLFKLQCLCDIHAELCDTVTTINSAYGLQMMVDVLSVFLHLVITPYFFLLGLLYPVTYGNTDSFFLFLQGAWIVFHVTKLFLIVQPCSVTIQELKIFALQLVHRKVEFSACGFYVLDFPLIASIAGSITTYLVIIIQFQNSDVEHAAKVEDKP